MKHTSDAKKAETSEKKRKLKRSTSSYMRTQELVRMMYNWSQTEKGSQYVRSAFNVGLFVGSIFLIQRHGELFIV